MPSCSVTLMERRRLDIMLQPDRCRRRPWLLLVLLPALLSLACSTAPAATGTRPPVIETVMARRTETALATRGAASPLAGYRLLVANSGSAELTVIDPIGRRVVGRVPVGEEPWDVVATADGRQAFVSTRAGIAVVDLAAEQVTRTIPTAFLPQGLALTPDGAWLYVGSRTGRTLAVIDLASDALTEWPSGQWHFGLAASADGRWVLAPGHYTRSLTVVDARERQVAQELTIDPLGEGVFNLPHYAVISPDSRYAYLPFQGRALVRVTLGTWAVDTFPLAIDAHQHGLTISPDGRRLYVVNVSQHNSLSEIDTADFREVRRIPLGGPHERVLLSPDGATAFLSGGYTLGGSDDISLIDLASGQVTTMAGGGSQPVGLALARRLP